jgi:hypothetical protein
VRNGCMKTHPAGPAHTLLSAGYPFGYHFAAERGLEDDGIRVFTRGATHTETHTELVDAEQRGGDVSA